MQTGRHNPKKIVSNVLATAMCVLLSGFAYAETMEFNLPSPTFALSYSEDGMTVTTVNSDHLHTPGTLQVHTSDQIVRLSYDPNQDGVPDRFNLLGLEVIADVVNVHAEVDYSGVNGAVYGPLAAGTWTLDAPGNTGLLFVDIASCPPGSGVCLPPEVDNIVFEPALGTGSLSVCQGLAATIVGTSGNDTFSGTWAVDVINGVGGNDAITDFGGDDIICGGGGNDTLLMPSKAVSSFANPKHNGNDTVVGGNGVDTASFPGTLGDSGVRVDLLRGTASGVRHGNDTLSGIENASGSSVTDSLDGNSGVNVLAGGGGDDFLKGVFYPALSADSSDTLNGQSGRDTMDGGAGVDTCNGGPPTTGDTAQACERTTGVP